MNNKIIKIAIMYPNKHPWLSMLKRENIDIDIAKLNEILKSNKIDNTNIRRRIGWEIDRLIYLAAIEVPTIEDIIIKVKEDYYKLGFDLKEISDEMIKSLATRKDLNNTSKITSYKDFLSGNLSKNECSKHKKNICNWAIDLLMFYIYSDTQNRAKNFTEVVNMIDEKLKDILYDDSYDEETIVSKLKRTGLSNGSINNIFTKHLSKYNGEYSNLLSKVFSFDGHSSSKEDEFDLTAALCGMVEEFEKNEEMEEKEALSNIAIKLDEEIDDNNNIDVKAMAKENIEPKEVVKEDTECYEEELGGKLDAIKINVEAIADKLGYKLVLKEQEIISKEYQENLLKINKNKEEAFLKKLVSLNEGAVLSELYNLYKNINTTDKTNIEATLGSFFSTLFVYGLEVNDHNELKIGKEIEVDTKDLLSKFIVSKPVNQEGILKGTVKYHEWKYKGKTIMPLVLTPTE